MELLKTKAFVISSIRWKESSKIVTLFTEKKGLIKVIVRGALRSNSSFSGKIESLNLLDAIIYNKESRSIQELRDCELQNAFNTIRLNLKLLPYALAVMEILSQVLEDNHTDETFFLFIENLILALNENTHPENVFLYFLLKLSSYLGFKPNFQMCSGNNLEKCDSKVFLSIDTGVVYCAHCRNGQANPIALRRDQFFFLKNLQMVHYRRLGSWQEESQDLSHLIRSLVNYINFHLDRSLHINALQLLSDR